ncbi:MAG: 6-carboxy-5,6,7,8-tetrahydropterin synthase [Alphaproteobacteria bacterium CG11_big_fil_rev_8_21_14_0_20_44_7]|nr:MAG: 6-carboxy-5,6,7,8-tetrahydropterin synthase [Alphaproteobacteria bacterium CG11_big_fil_rev_8_21_14_0_20_44_7]
MKTTCTISVNFTGAHRLVGQDIPCSALHGHFYRVDFTFTSTELDEYGMVIEFDSAKELLQGWFVENWDHNIILHESDRNLGEAISAITKQKIFYVGFNPTAENLGRYLMNEICPKLFAGKTAKCTRIHMQETPEYSATIES